MRNVLEAGNCASPFHCGSRKTTNIPDTVIGTASTASEGFYRDSLFTAWDYKVVNKETIYAIFAGITMQTSKNTPTSIRGLLWAQERVRFGVPSER